MSFEWYMWEPWVGTWSGMNITEELGYNDDDHYHNHSLAAEQSIQPQMPYIIRATILLMRTLTHQLVVPHKCLMRCRVIGDNCILATGAVIEWLECA